MFTHDTKSRFEFSRGSMAGFTALEFLIVIICTAVVLGSVLFLSGSTDPHLGSSLAQNEMRELRSALLRFREDTGFLPNTGPFARDALRNSGDSRRGQSWFESPANMSQLFEQPVDAEGQPILPWNADTGRGWHGPYLRHDVEGYVDIADSLAADGTGSPVGDGSPPLSRVPAVADPFEHPPVGPYLQWYIEKGIHAGLSTQIPFVLARHGRPYLLFDLDDRDAARIVSCGPDGAYDSQNPRVQLDNIVLYVFR